MADLNFPRYGNYPIRPSPKTGTGIMSTLPARGSRLAAVGIWSIGKCFLPCLPIRSPPGPRQKSPAPTRSGLRTSAKSETAGICIIPFPLWEAKSPCWGWPRPKPSIRLIQKADGRIRVWCWHQKPSRIPTTRWIPVFAWTRQDDLGSSGVPTFLASSWRKRIRRLANLCRKPSIIMWPPGSRATATKGIPVRESKDRSSFVKTGAFIFLSLWRIRSTTTWWLGGQTASPVLIWTGWENPSWATAAPQ